MKNYFDFQLRGKQLLPLWIIFYFVVLAPYFFILFKLSAFSQEAVVQKPSPAIGLLFIPVILGAMIWSLYFTKFIVQGVSLNDTPVKADYRLGRFLGILFLGFFLSIVTIGIYLPWFIGNMQRFFIDNSSYKERNFSFQGQSGRLFLILTLSLIVPMIIFIVITFKTYGIDANNQSVVLTITKNAITQIILIPYIYLLYKWLVDIKYAEYHIKWDTQFFPSVWKIFIEMALTIVTLGIYMPMAYLRLYKYFAEKTKSNEVDNQRIQFGYDIDQMNDFLIIWGQILLTAVTLGIYYPWAFCKITQRVLSKTFVEKLAR
jgi:uncharacterized membrane protein YjgN (DUF898 family)